MSPKRAVADVNLALEELEAREITLLNLIHAPKAVADRLEKKQAKASGLDKRVEAWRELRGKFDTKWREERLRMEKAQELMARLEKRDQHGR